MAVLDGVSDDWASRSADSGGCGSSNHSTVKKYTWRPG
jgi:hypothetical protein